MAVGDSGRHVQTTALVKPKAFVDRVGAHIHKGSPVATNGGPGVTTAPGANQQGSSGGGSPYGGGGDGSNGQ
jgi:hypothetical protein